MAVETRVDATRAAAVLHAERAREMAEIHRAACRWRRQGAVCSTCSDLDERAVRLARRMGEAAS